jgi:hypothetical protein
MSAWPRRLGIVLALGFCLMPLLLAGEKKGETRKKEATAKPKLERFRGKVVPLADVVKKIGAQMDEDAAPYFLALVTADGKVYTLIKDDSSRLFYKDKTLLNRPMELAGRIVPGSGNLLHVTQARSIRNGKLCELYYWCDVCSIKSREKVICGCCGGPMELHEEPVEK